MTHRSSEAEGLAGISDERLMFLYTQHGSHEAFGVLYGRHAGRVNAYLAKRLASRADVDELLQAIFLKFHKCRYQYDSKYEVGQWVFAICKSVLNDHFRKKAHDPTLYAESSDGIPDNAGRESAPDLKIDAAAALESLSATERQAVHWRYLDSLEYAEIASRLGRNEASIRQIVSRATRKLKVLFADPGEES